jgi:hypothetical protein
MILKQRYIRLGRRKPNRLQFITQMRIPSTRGLASNHKDVYHACNDKMEIQH